MRLVSFFNTSKWNPRLVGSRAEKYNILTLFSERVSEAMLFYILFSSSSAAQPSSCRDVACRVSFGENYGNYHICLMRDAAHHVSIIERVLYFPHMELYMSRHLYNFSSNSRTILIPKKTREMTDKNKKMEKRIWL